MNSQHQCAAVRQHLAVSQPPLPDTLQDHVATCAVCQGALVLLAIAGLSDAPPPIACAACEELLPVYAERFLNDPGGALLAWPQVWQHLMQCDACLEDWQMLRRVLQAEQAGTLIPMQVPFAAVTPTYRPLLTLTRSFLHAAIPQATPALALMRGTTTGPVVLADEHDAEPQFTLSVMRQADGDWQIQIRVIPPPIGVLYIQCGDQRWQSQFDPDGYAIVTAIPEAVLMAADGPAFEVGIITELPD